MNISKILWSSIVIFLLLSVAVNAKYSINRYNTTNTDNEQIYLGYVNVYGNGSISRLEAVAQNNIQVKIESNSEKVNFYIDYNMECTGLTDEGSIILIVSINGQNTTPASVITFTEKNGSLVIDNVSVKRRDIVAFYIQVFYTSLLHVNETSAFGGGVVSKPFFNNINIRSLLFYRFLEIFDKFQTFNIKYDLLFI